MKAQSDINISGSHYFFELRNLSLSGDYSDKSSLEVKVRQVALYDYVLEHWRLPSIKELKAESKSANKISKEFFSKSKEKDQRRRSEIQKITKTTVRRKTKNRTMSKSQTKLRMSAGNFGDNQGFINQPEEQAEDDPDEFMTADEEETKSQIQSEVSDANSNDDSQSFKSFAMELGNDGGSVASSIHDSAFEDAVDEVDYWQLNHAQQHFSLIPVLTMSSFKNISKSIRSQYENVKLYSSVKSSKEGKPMQGLSESTYFEKESNFQFSHHFIDPEKLL